MLIIVYPFQEPAWTNRLEMFWTEGLLHAEYSDLSCVKDWCGTCVWVAIWWALIPNSVSSLSLLRPPASQQPHWPTPTPPPPPPISRLSADAPIFTPGGQMEPEKPALSCSALPFIPSESTRAMAEMASNMNASAEEFMPTLMNQVDKSWEEEAWKEPWKPEVQTWNDRKWAQHETHRYDEGEYMKGDPKGKGWGKGKGRMNNGKGQNWNTNNNTTWKGSNNRGMSGAQYGQHNTQHNSQHNSQHNGHRRPNEWNDWEEHWDDWEEKEWSDEAWRSQWRGAEPKPNKWAQDPELRKTSPKPPKKNMVFPTDSFPKRIQKAIKPWFGIGSRGSKIMWVPTISDLHRKFQWLSMAILMVKMWFESMGRVCSPQLCHTKPWQAVNPSVMVQSKEKPMVFQTSFSPLT